MYAHALDSVFMQDRLKKLENTSSAKPIAPVAPLRTTAPAEHQLPAE